MPKCTQIYVKTFFRFLSSADYVVENEAKKIGFPSINTKRSLTLDPCNIWPQLIFSVPFYRLPKKTGEGKKKFYIKSQLFFLTDLHCSKLGTLFFPNGSLSVPKTI